MSVRDVPFNEVRVKEIYNTKIEDLWEQLEKETCLVACFEKEELSHRFPDIRCPKETVISVGGSYLHANSVGGGLTNRKMIASQAPLEGDRPIFWQGVCEYEAVIIDLTNSVDERRGVTKYYPRVFSEVFDLGDISIRFTGCSENLVSYEVVDRRADKVTQVSRYHFTDWPDRGVVSLEDFSKLVAKIDEFKGSIWMHCRAGVGRTGTLTTALIIKEKIQNGGITIETLDESLVAIIVELRKQRGPYFVQNHNQLNLLREHAISLLKNHCF